MKGKNMAQKIESCPHCGKRMSTNKYSMNTTLLRALSKLAKFPGRKAREIMDKSEYSVYTKLKFWSFAQKEEDGLWYITPAGERFLRGEIRAVKEITYYNDQAIDQGREFVYSHQIFKTPESKQKYREFMAGVI